MPETAKSTFRIPKANLELAKKIGKRLGGATNTQVVNLGLLALADRLGLTDQDAAFAMDRLAVKYGDDAMLIVTVTQWDDDGESVDATVTATVNSEELEDWTVLFVGLNKVRLRPERPGKTSAIVHVVHDSTGANFVLGPLEVRQGAQIGVRIRDLPENVVALPSEQEMDAAELRRHVREAFRLRRMLGLAVDQDFTENDENEEVLLPDENE